MAGIIERVAWDVAAADAIGYRFPNLQVKFGTQVIVRENQKAVFFRDGKAYDVFGAGRHTVSSANIPLLTQYLEKLNLIQQGIFECEVIFVSISQFTAKFGGKAYSAPGATFAYQAEVGYHGQTIYEIDDPKMFVVELFGNKALATSEAVEDYLRDFINQNVQAELGRVDIVMLTQQLPKASEKVNLAVSDIARGLGIKLRNMAFEVMIPEEARRFAAMGDRAMTMQYMKETAAELGPGEGGGMAGAGIGMGAGLGMAQMMMGAMQGAPGAQAMVLCPACRAQNPQTAKFCSSCGGSLAPKPAATVACPKCQAQNPQGAKFCTSCGNAFA